MAWTNMVAVEVGTGRWDRVKIEVTWSSLKMWNVRGRNPRWVQRVHLHWLLIYWEENASASNFAILIPTHPNDWVKCLSLSQIISILPSTLRFYFPGLKKDILLSLLILLTHYRERPEDKDNAHLVYCTLCRIYFGALGICPICWLRFTKCETNQANFWVTYTQSFSEQVDNGCAGVHSLWQLLCQAPGKQRPAGKVPSAACGVYWILLCSAVISRLVTAISYWHLKEGDACQPRMVGSLCMSGSQWIPSFKQKANDNWGRGWEFRDCVYR